MLRDDSAIVTLNNRVLLLRWGAPRACQPDGWIARPPKSRFFKTDQTPLELGKGKGRGKHKGKYRGLGKGKWAGSSTLAVAQSVVADI